MPSPFPGMDPYIEGQLWSGFHTQFLGELQAAIVPQLPPGYVVVIEEQVYREHLEERARSVDPDVAVVAGRPAPTTGGGTAIAAAPVTVPLPMSRRVRQRRLELRYRASGDVVTVVELLSPANKRLGTDFRRQYLAKRDAVIDSSEHLVELDLLRGGARLRMAKDLPPGDYYVLVSRVERRPGADVWRVGLRERRPPIGLPLAGRDPEVEAVLQAVVDRVYHRAGFERSLDYELAPSPPLSAEDLGWARSLVAAGASSPGA